MGAAAPKLKSPQTMESPPSSFTCHTCQTCPQTLQTSPHTFQQNFQACQTSPHTFQACQTSPHTYQACQNCPHNCQEKCVCQGGSAGEANGPEDAFMTAVLSFCSHMSGQLDALDNSSIYDEFRNYTAAAQKVAVS